MSSLILSIDPGKATGWFLGSYSDTFPLEHLEHGIVHDGLQGFLAWWAKSWPVQRVRTYGGTVLAENFRLDGRAHSKAIDTTPLEILGALEVLSPGYIRVANTQKVHAPDDLLKRIGMYWPGAGHDRDAGRHAAAWLKTNKHRPTLEAFWKREETE